MKDQAQKTAETLSSSSAKQNACRRPPSNRSTLRGTRSPRWTTRCGCCCCSATGPRSGSPTRPTSSPSPTRPPTACWPCSPTTASSARTGTARTAPGPALLDVGLAAVRHLDVRAICRPLLDELAAATGETVHCGVLEAATIRYVDAVESTRVLRVAGRTGMALPAHCSAAGKALLARLEPAQLRLALPERAPGDRHPRSIGTFAALARALDRVRRTGYAVNRGESEDGDRGRRRRRRRRARPAARGGQLRGADRAHGRRPRRRDRRADDDGGVRPMTAELRRRVAVACRILAHAGLAEDILGHVSARVDDDTILVRARGPAEAGLLFSTPDDVIACSLDDRRRRSPPNGYVAAERAPDPPRLLPVRSSRRRRRPRPPAMGDRRRPRRDPTRADGRRLQHPGGAPRRRRHRHLPPGRADQHRRAGAGDGGGDGRPAGVRAARARGDRDRDDAGAGRGTHAGGRRPRPDGLSRGLARGRGAAAAGGRSGAAARPRRRRSTTSSSGAITSSVCVTPGLGIEGGDG